MSKLWTWLLVTTGVAACPCHFPVTLPLLVTLAGGTGLAGFIAAHTGIVYGIATVYFVGVTAAGIWALSRRAGPGNVIRRRTTATRAAAPTPYR